MAAMVKVRQERGNGRAGRSGRRCYDGEITEPERAVGRTERGVGSIRVGVSKAWYELCPTAITGSFAMGIVTYEMSRSTYHWHRAERLANCTCCSHIPK